MVTVIDKQNLSVLILREIIVLLSIREDDKQNLWISTENGICKFIPSEERFESYDERSITFPVRFSEAASTLTAKGNMLFGASGGVFIFNPDSIRKSSYVPPIVFSKLTVANEDVVPGEQSLLQADIEETQLYIRNLLFYGYLMLQPINSKQDINCHKNDN